MDTSNSANLSELSLQKLGDSIACEENSQIHGAIVAVPARDGEFFVLLVPPILPKQSLDRIGVF